MGELHGAIALDPIYVLYENIIFLTHLPIIVMKSRLLMGKHQQFSYSFLKYGYLGFHYFTCVCIECEHPWVEIIIL